MKIRIVQTKEELFKKLSEIRSNSMQADINYSADFCSMPDVVDSYLVYELGGSWISRFCRDDIFRYLGGYIVGNTLCVTRIYCGEDPHLQKKLIRWMSRYASSNELEVSLKNFVLQEDVSLFNQIKKHR